MNSRIAPVLAVVLSLLLSWLPGAVPAVAQEGDPSSSTGATGEVNLQIVQFGAGKYCRAGEYAGVHVELQDRMVKPRQLLLRLAIPDADGDTALATTSVATNGGQKQHTWLYPRLPFWTSSGTVYTLQAYEEIVGASGEHTGKAGKLVGSYTYRLQGMEVAPAVCGLMAIVGRQNVNLDRYTVRTTSGNICQPFGHEVVHQIVSLRPGTSGASGELPDRWYGLAQFSTLVWVGSGPEGEPTSLSQGQADAIREWVERGNGHLVVVLPPAGQAWIGSADNPLASIMPRVSVQRLEGVDLETLHPLLLGEHLPNRILPSGQIMHVFTPDPKAEPQEAIRLLTTPEDKAVAVRRNVGTGAVTVIGIDLTSRQMLQSGGVETDVFWHRILGKRGVLVDQQELAKISSKLGFGIDARGPRNYDSGIQDQISKAAAAGIGLLLAFIVFITYWVLAGPLGFAALRKKGWSHHGWLSFVIAGAAFTALAWGGATVLRPMTISAVHLSFIDHVFGQNIDRARSYVSVLLPRYGQMSVSVADPDPNSRMHNALSSWDEPKDRDTGGAGSFPDARGYEIDGRHPAAASYPSRFTTKVLQADWAGGPPWKMISPVTLDEAGQYKTGGQIRLMEASTKQGLLSGVLMHELPEPLKEVVIVVVEGQTLRFDTQSSFANGIPTRPGATPGKVTAFRLVTPIDWAPKQPLDLSQVTMIDLRTSDQLGEQFLKSMMGPGDQDALEGRAFQSPADISKNYTALAFFSMLHPPEIGSQLGLNNQVPLARRRSTQSLDLSRWFTQPCVIIVGQMGDKNTEGTCPIPFLIDVAPEDRAKATPLRKMTGRTFVRWVYPLPDRPTVYKTVEPAEAGNPATPSQ